MKYYIFIRHALHFSDQLTIDGKKQMQNILTSLSGYELGKVHIISSDIRYAYNSALIIANTYNTEVEKSAKVIWLIKKDKQNKEKSFLFIQQRQEDTTADTVIVVTHQDEVNHIPYFAAQTLFNDTSYFKTFCGFGMADMLVMNIEEKNFVFYRNSIREE